MFKSIIILGGMAHACNPRAEEEGMDRYLGTIGCQPRLLGKLQGSETLPQLTPME